MLLEKLSVLLEADHPRLANRIDSFLHTIEAFNNSRAEQFLCSPIINYIDYINKTIDSTEGVDSGEYLEAENEIKHCLELAESGLAQRVWSSVTSSGYNHAVPQPFSDGIFASLVGIEQVIRFIFNTWLEIHRNQDVDLPVSDELIAKYDSFRPYIGFAKFNDMSGFSGTWGESFNLPLSALYDPIGDEGNWLTLTHEISHAIYSRLEIGKQHNGFIEDYIHVGLESAPEETEIKEFHNHIFELFAHWYDYIHFYEENFEPYAGEIWRAWSKLSVFTNNFKDYFFRSFFIYCTSKQVDLIGFHRNGQSDQRDAVAKVEELYDLHLQFVNSLGIDSSHLSNMQNKEVFGQLARQMWTCFGILEKFEKYRSDQFTLKINETYTDLDKHVAKIQAGHFIIEDIKNPYLLAKKVIMGTNSNNLRASIALVFSLKNRGSFYYAIDKTD